jgi:hypothetical protein
LLAVIRQDGAAAFKMFCWAQNLLQRSAVQLSWPAAAMMDLPGAAEQPGDDGTAGWPAPPGEKVLVLVPGLEGLPKVSDAGWQLHDRAPYGWAGGPWWWRADRCDRNLWL